MQLYCYCHFNFDKICNASWTCKIYFYIQIRWFYTKDCPFPDDYWYIYTLLYIGQQTHQNMYHLSFDATCANLDELLVVHILWWYVRCRLVALSVAPWLNKNIWISRVSIFKICFRIHFSVPPQGKYFAISYSIPCKNCLIKTFLFVQFLRHLV